jgi:hypothetical protein
VDRFLVSIYLEILVASAVCAVDSAIKLVKSRIPNFAANGLCIARKSFPAKRYPVVKTP